MSRWTDERRELERRRALAHRGEGNPRGLPFLTGVFIWKEREQVSFCQVLIVDNQYSSGGHLAERAGGSLCGRGRERREHDVELEHTVGEHGAPDARGEARADARDFGAFTLEALGLALDPLRCELEPIPMVLGGWRTMPVDS